MTDISLFNRAKRKKLVVFLCTGNTCRGPMAQGYMRHLLEERGIDTVECRAAGASTINGLVPTPEVIQVMDAAGIDIRKHRSSQLTPELIRKADLILGMTPFHVQEATRKSDLARGKTYLLKEYTKSDLKNYQITDPMGATLEVYKRVFREIRLAIDRLMEMDVVTGRDEAEDKARKKAAAPAKPAAPVAGRKPAPVAAAKPGDVRKPVRPAVPAAAGGKKIAAGGAVAGAKPAAAKPVAAPARRK